MNSRSFIYLILMVSLSLITGFVEWIIDLFFNSEFLVGLIIFFVIHIHSYKLYNILCGISEKIKISKGLIYSSFIGILILLVIVQGDYSYEKKISQYGVESGSYIYYYIVGVYLIIALICFVVDAFFNQETNKIKKQKVLFGSILFYTILLITNFVLAGFTALIVGGIS